VAGFVAEGGRARLGDFADEAQALGDVGLAGPLGEGDDRGLELAGELAEAAVVVEPGVEELFVAR